MATQIRDIAPFVGDQEHLRASVRAAMAAGKLSQADVARESGVAYGTLTSWLGGTYSGRNERVAAEVQVWLAAREEKKRALAVAPEAPPYMQTPTAHAFVDALLYAQIMPQIVVIAGGAGIGKTTAALRYRATSPNVWIATVEPQLSGIFGILTEIAGELGVDERVPARLGRAVGTRVKGVGGLLVIDEAQHLKIPALEQLRSLHDKYGVGLALLGNEQVHALFGGDKPRPGFAQLFSRVGSRITQARPCAADIDILIDGWGVADAEEKKLLRAIARKPGALRGLSQTMKFASILAAGAGKRRDIRHIRAAWDRYDAGPINE
jgi:hypothetical protein